MSVFPEMKTIYYTDAERWTVQQVREEGYRLRRFLADEWGVDLLQTHLEMRLEPGRVVIQVYHFPDPSSSDVLHGDS